MSAADYGRKAALNEKSPERDINLQKPKQQAVTDSRVLGAYHIFFLFEL